MIYPKPQSGVFAQDAPESEIKPFNAWLRGLGIAFDETNGFPDMESFNGLLQTLNSYIKYLEQNGFAEWTADLEYPIGAGVRVGSIWYRAKTQNTNKPPATSQNDWSVFLNASDLTYADPLLIDGRTVRIKDATQTQKGVVRFATNTEAQTGANVSAAITPNQAMLTSFGVGQTWQDVTSSRSLRGIYTNSTGKPIMVNIHATGILTLYVDGVVVSRSGWDSWSDATNRGLAQVTAVVPNGSTYELGSPTVYTSNTIKWVELR